MKGPIHPALHFSLNDGRRTYFKLFLIGIFAIGGGVGFVQGGPPLLNLIYHAVLGNSSAAKDAHLWDPSSPLTIVPLALLGALVGVYLGAILSSVWVRWANRWEGMDSGGKVTLMLGAFIGLIASIPVVLLFNALNLPTIYLPLLIFGLTLGLSAIAIYALQTMQEILPWYRNRGPAKRTGIKILDTNVIIDARIYDVAKTGFLEGEIYVPKFVLEELQHIADHHDSLRRQRGRRGLEVLKHLQAEFPMEVGKYDKFAPDADEEVDSRLVRIAKIIGADIVTNDWNLNSVAKLQNVKILNLNELALTLRPTVLPQERMELSIIREGNQPLQGVGYLEDGTMVVVENGRAHMGETLEVTVTQVIQTERGKMIFAEVEGQEEGDDSYYTRKPRRK